MNILTVEQQFRESTTRQLNKFRKIFQISLKDINWYLPPSVFLTLNTFYDIFLFLDLNSLWSLIRGSTVVFVLIVISAVQYVTVIAVLLSICVSPDTPILLTMTTIPILEDTVTNEDLAVRYYFSFVVTFTFACELWCDPENRFVSRDRLFLLQRYEYAFNKSGNTKTKFDYALCLLRSPYKADMAKAVLLLTELRQENEQQNDRDYLFHLAVVHTRLNEYSEAEKFADILYRMEPNNSQVTTLRSVIAQRKNNQTVSDVAALSVFSAIVGIAFFIFRGMIRRWIN